MFATFLEMVGKGIYWTPTAPDEICEVEIQGYTDLESLEQHL